MRTRTFWALVIAFTLCGCDSRSTFELLLPKEEVAYAKDILAKLRAHDFDAVAAPLDPALRDAQTRKKLEELAAFFPEQEPAEIDVVGSRVFKDLKTDVTRYDLTFQYEYPKQWVLASVLLERGADAVIVKGVHVQPLTESLQHLNRFTLQGKGVAQYFMLGWAILVPIFIVGSLVACIKIPVPRRKWLWIIFLLFGLGQITVDWTTGALDFRLLSCQFLGAGFFWQGPYGAIVLSGSIPVGAILFWIRRRRWRAIQAAKAAELFG